MRLLEADEKNAGFIPAQLDRIRHQAEQWVASESGTDSLVLLAARKGKIEFFEAFGRQDYASDSPLSRDSIFYVASISKVITATLAMQMVERGELSLNRFLKEYVPEMSGKYADRILMHQLLTHTSGLAEVDDPPLWISPPETDVPCPPGETAHRHKYFQALYKDDCYEKPGTQNMYANKNFNLLGEVIERICGRSLEEVAQSQLFEPLGLSNTTFLSPHALPAPVCQPDPSGLILESSLLDENVYGAATLKSNALELATFCQMFLNGGSYGGQQILHPWTVKEMTRNQIPGTGAFNFARQWVNEGSWGLGWMVQGDARWPWSHGFL